MTAVSAFVAEVIAQGALDADTGDVLTWLNRKHREFVARAEMARGTVTLTTSDGGATWDFPDPIAAVYEVDVDGATYGRARRSDISRGAQNRLVLSGPGGVFMVEQAGAVNAITAYPAVDADQAVTAYGALYPAALLLDDSVPLAVDETDEEALMAGVFSVAMSRPVEARQDLAAGYSQQFEVGVAAAKLRVTRAFRGPGPASIRVP